jgi:tetratricopeptide (TPR) repeat protein
MDADRVVAEDRRGRFFSPDFLRPMMENTPTMDALDEVDQLLAKGRYDEAIDLLEVIVESNPSEEPAWLRLAWAHWDAGNKDRSIACWERLLECEFSHQVFTGFAYDELVRIYRQEGLIDRLVTLCEKAVAIQPEDVGLLTEMGSTYLLSGNYEKACETFGKLSRMEEDNPLFACRLGEALCCAGYPAEGIEAFEKAAAIDPEEADRYFFQAADLFMKRNDATRAKNLLGKCLQIAPSNSLYYCSLGDALVALGQIDDAFAAYDEACRHNHHYAAAYFNRLGHTLMNANRFTQAVRAFEAALSLDESTPCREMLERAFQASAQSPT